MEDDAHEMTDLASTEAQSDGKIHIPLSSPIRAFNKELTELALRKPAGADIIHVGNPVVIEFPADPNEMPKVGYDMMKVARMLSRLSDVPFSSIERMTPGDISAAAIMLAPFFMPTVPRTSSRPA